MHLSFIKSSGISWADLDPYILMKHLRCQPYFSLPHKDIRISNYYWQEKKFFKSSYLPHKNSLI